MRKFKAALVTISTALGLCIAVGTPAAAGDCPFPFCGGTVFNNNGQGRSVTVSNCWDNDSTWIQEGHFLNCHAVGDGTYRVGNLARAAIGIPAGSHTSRFSKFYDTDAVKFPSGCVTKAKFAWADPYYTDRRGLPPLWGRIDNLDEFTILEINC